MNINEIADKAYKHAENCGFYKENPENEIIKKIEEESRELVHTIQRKFYCDMETFDLLYKNNTHKNSFTNNFEGNIKNSIGDEMADNILIILAGARKLRIDIEKHLKYKQTYNESREDHK